MHRDAVLVEQPHRLRARVGDVGEIDVAERGHDREPAIVELLRRGKERRDLRMGDHRPLDLRLERVGVGE